MAKLSEMIASAERALATLDEALGRFATEWNRFAVPPVAKNRPK
jgi:hypothetical protein